MDQSDLYSALQAADSAGDAQSAQQIAAYIKSLPTGASQPGPVVTHGLYEQDTSRPEWQAKFGPTSNRSTDAGQFLDNLFSGMGSMYAGTALGANQLYAQATGGNPDAARDPFTGATAQEKAELDAPLNNTVGGFLGKASAVAPLTFMPGANTLLGATALGGGLGAMQPTQPGDSRVLNTAIGAASGFAGQAAGGKTASWLTDRANQPFLGWRPAAFDKALAVTAGSDEPALNQAAIKSTYDRLTGVFRQVRSPSVNTTLGQPSIQALQTIDPANPSARALFEANPNVLDFMEHLTSGKPVTAKQLGSISTALRQDASTQLTSEGGNREVGIALKALKEHVDDVIGGTITDPKLASAYASARPQYSVLMDAMDNPTLLNSATGRANATAWGKYLQRNDPVGYSTGANKSPLYQGARWGQATGEGRGAPPFTLGNFGVPWLLYHGTNNPLSRAVGGVVSKAGAPLAPQLGRAGQSLADPEVPTVAPWVRGFLPGPQ